MLSIHLAFKTAAGLEIKTHTHTQISRPLLAGTGGETNLLDYFETRQICKSYNAKPTTINTATVLPSWKEAFLQIAFSNVLCNCLSWARNSPSTRLPLSHCHRLANASPPSHLLLAESPTINVLCPGYQAQIFRLINSTDNTAHNISTGFFFPLHSLLEQTINSKWLCGGDGTVAACLGWAGWGRIPSPFMTTALGISNLKPSPNTPTSCSLKPITIKEKVRSHSVQLQGREQLCIRLTRFEHRRRLLVRSAWPPASGDGLSLTLQREARINPQHT